RIVRPRNFNRSEPMAAHVGRAHTTALNETVTMCAAVSDTSRCVTFWTITHDCTILQLRCLTAPYPAGATPAPTTRPHRARCRSADAPHDPTGPLRAECRPIAR